MSRKLFIARGVTELGPLTGSEVRELLCEGFLLPADLYWEEGMADWAELGEFKSEPPIAGKSAGLVKFTGQKVSSAARTTAARAADLTRKLQSFAGRGQTRLSNASGRVLDSFAPQIQKLVSHEVVRQSAAHMQQAIHNDDFMQKFFGAIYDCLPKPVCRFVTEKAFIQYCMERRLKMLGMDTTQTDSRSADIKPAQRQID